jgi:hypothetical protein
MCPKIQYDEESKQFCKIFWKLNRALFKLLSWCPAHGPMRFPAGRHHVVTGPLSAQLPIPLTGPHHRAPCLDKASSSTYRAAEPSVCHSAWGPRSQWVANCHQQGPGTRRETERTAEASGYGTADRQSFMDFRCPILGLNSRYKQCLNTVAILFLFGNNYSNID